MVTITMTISGSLENRNTRLTIRPWQGGSSSERAMGLTRRLMQIFRTTLIRLMQRRVTKAAWKKVRSSLYTALYRYLGLCIYRTSTTPVPILFEISFDNNEAKIRRYTCGAHHWSGCSRTNAGRSRHYVQTVNATAIAKGHQRAFVRSVEAVEQCLCLFRKMIFECPIWPGNIGNVTGILFKTERTRTETTKNIYFLAKALASESESAIPFLIVSCKMVKCFCNIWVGHICKIRFRYSHDARRMSLLLWLKQDVIIGTKRL